MILPGHLAASLLAARRFALDTKVALLAGVAPDLVDKFVFYILHASHWTRVPGHSPLALLFSSGVAAIVGWRYGKRWRWGTAWLAGYGLHLLGDIVPGEGVLPWLWPFESYAGIVSPTKPWFLTGGPVPWLTLTIELLLVMAAVSVEWKRWRARPKPAPKMS